ncbi:MAG: polymer-forming cytoskeletal protein [Alphaproteobacteria bacterium]|nr:polymer-forming cytoskeletal protein [Alphaproteobacteria bacterium]
MLFKKRSSGHSELPRPMAGTSHAPPPSVIANDLKVTGTILSSGTVVVDGNVEGDIYGAHVTIGEGGLIRGTVNASECVISGRVTGTLRATAIALRPSGTIDGDIGCRTLSVGLGASLNGKCRHVDNPVADLTDHGPNHEAPLPKSRAGG